MAALMLASLWCWVWSSKGSFRCRAFVVACDAQDRTAVAPPLLTGVVNAGEEESRRRIPGETAGEVRARISDAMARTARELLTRSEGGLPNLAVIASVTPFVGLFGTVWGIMTSFAAISQAQDTSLATVAPGIAEISGRDGLWTGRRHTGLDRLQSHRRGLRTAGTGDGVLRRGTRDCTSRPSR